MMAPLPLGSRFDEALAYASQHHRSQARKGTTIPYVAHLLQVAGLVLEAGGGEGAAVAALLHDAIEDALQGEAPRITAEIKERFGARVLEIVEALTDGTEPKGAWQPRKEAYLTKLEQEADPDVLLVSSADKLHNVRAIVRDLRDVGHDLWARFTGKRDGTLWYYADLVRVYDAAGGTPLLPEFRRAVTELEWLAAMPDPTAAQEIAWQAA